MMNVSRAKSRSMAFFFGFFLYFGLLTPSFGCRLVIFFFHSFYPMSVLFVGAIFFLYFSVFFFCILQSNTTSTTTANSSNENKLTYCFVPCGNNKWLDFFFFLAFGHNQSVRYIVWGIFVHTKMGYPVSNPLYKHIVYTVVSERL